MKFQSIVASVLTIACSFCAFTSRAATTEPLTEDISRQLKGDEEYDLKEGTLTINEGVEIDLNGYKLTYKNVSAFSGSGYITDTSKGSPGELHLSISKNASTTAAITGNVKLVYEGGSTLTIPKSSTYGGGTVVSGGTLVSNSGNLKKINPLTFLPFGFGGNIVVNSGGTLEVKAYTDWPYNINLNGGALKNTGANNTKFDVFNAPITLTADSTYSLTANYCFPSTINIANHTLTLSLGADCYFMPTAITSDDSLGTIATSGSKTLYLKKSFEMNDVNFVLASPLSTFNDKTSDVYDLGVHDLEFRSGASVNGNGKIIVHGALKPVDGVAPICTLVSGATIDVGGAEMPCDLSGVMLDGVTELVVSLGDKTPELGDPIVDFGRKLNDVTVTFAGSEVKGVVTDNGVLTYGTSMAPVATWTGVAGNGNVKDSGNWKGGLMPSAAIAAVFSGEIGKLSIPAGTELDWSKVTFDNVTLTEDCDLSGLNPEIITALSVIDVRGSMLTLAGKEGAYACAATITATSAEGALRIDVPENATYTNSAFTLTGKLNLVKDGLGTMVAADDKDFEGELIVEQGTLVCGLSNLSGKTPFGAGNTITLEADGILDPKGAINWSGKTIKFNGGKILNTVKATGVATAQGAMKDYEPNGQNNSTPIPFNPTLVLLADAVIETTEDFNFQGTVEESEYVLHLQVPKGHYFVWYPASAKDLKLDVSGDGALGVLSKKPVPRSAQSGIQLTLSGAAITLPKHASYGEGTMDVSDYTAACTNSVAAGGAALNVYGTFTPAAVDEEGKEYFYGATMQSGSAIDLSKKTAVWGIKSASFGNNTVKFAEGTGESPTRVTIKLGTRKFEPGEKVIEWTTKPIGVEFDFKREDDKIPPKARALAKGLYYGEEPVTAAEWTGEASDGNLSNSLNWKGGILPTGKIQAKFTGDVSSIQPPSGDSFVCKEIYFDGAKLSQTTDFSWLDLNKLTDDSVLNINGHVLKIASTNSISTTSATITDSVGGGVVEFTVGEGVVHTNASLALEGGLKLVKKGTGVFVAAKYPQLYTNVTEVVEGGIRCAEGQWMNKEDGKSPFGAACTIALGAGTFLDPAGSYAWANHTIEMNGGIISNTVAQSGMSNTDYHAGKDSFTKPFNPTLDLSVNSLFVSTVNFNFKGTVKGNGHVLTVDINESYYGTRWLSHDSTEATVVFKTNTLVRILKNFPMYEPDLTLVMDGAKFDVGGNWAVSNYIAKSETAISNYRSTTDGGWSLTVYGTFRPETSDFLGCVMQNGSTLDLSAQTGVFNLYNPQGQKNLDAGGTPWLCQHVTFANDATVTIDVHRRTFGGKNKKIVSWTEETQPANVSFIIDAKSKAEGYRLMPTADGISVERSGMLLMLK